MRISKLARSMLIYLPVLAVLVATGIGTFLGKDLYRRSLDSQSKTPSPAQLLLESNNLPWLPLPGLGSHCFSSNIYTSLPPKCKTFDGEFIPLPGTLNGLVIPAGK
jgi:hypothetical protein